MRSMLLLAAAVAALSGPAAAQAPASAPVDLHAAIAADYDANLGALWEHLHRNPELSTLEVRTAARMAQELRALGYDVTTGVGGNGVVAVLRNGPGPTVMLRADMDGLPIREETGLPVMLSDDPVSAVVLGSGKALDQIELLREVTIN